MRRHLFACFCVVFVLSALLFGAASATDHRFIESFNTKQYCDTVNTTALWDTVAGELRLPPCEFEIVGAYETYDATGVAIDGDYAYVADGIYGIQIIDVTNLESPSLLGTYDTPGTACDVFADGNHIYVADGSSGIIVVDVTNPAAPALLGSYNTSGSAYDVVVEGDYAYVADNTSGLVVLNVVNPASPTLAGSYNTPGNARGLTVAGNLAFVADGVLGGLQIIDISTPDRPVLVGSCDTPGSVNGVDVAGDFAYVADGSYGLQVIDVSSPASPGLVGGVTLSGIARRIDVEGDFAYISDFAPGLTEIDISNPSAPVVTRSVATPDNAWDVAISGNHAFVAAVASGLQIVRISAPMTPRMEGLCSAGAKPSDVAIDGDYAYVAAGTSGLQVVDISDPSAPFSAGSYATPDSCCFVAVDGDYAFASVSGAGVIVLSIVNPSSPVFLGSYDTPGLAQGIAISGDQAFVADGFTGLIVLDIGNPASPALLGTCDTPGYANHVAVAGNYAFVLDGSYGLQVIDIADPAHPAIAGNCLGAAWGSIAIAGDYALAAAGTSGVRSFDISNPASPVLVRTLYSGGRASDIAVAGDYAFVAVSTDQPSLKVIDITDPASIPVAWTQALPSPAVGVALAGDHAFVGETASGFRTCRIAQSNFLVSERYTRSSVLDFVDEPIVKVRFSTAQTDSIKWFVSAMGGVNWSWQDVPPDWTWRTITYPGTNVLWYSLHFLSDYTSNPTCSELMLEWLYKGAVIDSIRDIPGDQGGQVRVHFARSGYDFSDEATHPIATYNVWRRMDGAALASTNGDPLPMAAEGKFGDLPVMNVGGRLMLASNPTLQAAGMPPGTWEVMESFSATQLDQYVHPTLTLADSTVEDGMAYAVYMVTAHTTTPSVWYASAPDSGYSLDNLAPHVPTSFAVAYNSGGANDLSWDACPDYDFEYFKVYRGTSEDFVPDSGNLVETTIAAGWLDTVEQGYQYFYKITAVDHAGNESAPASAGTVTDAGPPVLPRSFALHQNVPNPFNPTTTIRFDLPASADVRLVIYNVSGQKIRELASGPMAAGTREVTWDGRDAAGRAAASGIYFYRLDAGRFTQTRKMILLR